MAGMQDAQIEQQLMDAWNRNPTDQNAEQIDRMAKQYGVRAPWEMQRGRPEGAQLGPSGAMRPLMRPIDKWQATDEDVPKDRLGQSRYEYERGYDNLYGVPGDAPPSGMMKLGGPKPETAPINMRNAEAIASGDVNYGNGHPGVQDMYEPAYKALYDARMYRSTGIPPDVLHGGNGRPSGMMKLGGPMPGADDRVDRIARALGNPSASEADRINTWRRDLPNKGHDLTDILRADAQAVGERPPTHRDFNSDVLADQPRGRRGGMKPFRRGGGGPEYPDF